MTLISKVLSVLSPNRVNILEGILMMEELRLNNSFETFFKSDIFNFTLFVKFNIVLKFNSSRLLVFDNDLSELQELLVNFEIIVEEFGSFLKISSSLVDLKFLKKLHKTIFLLLSKILP